MYGRKWYDKEDNEIDAPPYEVRVIRSNDGKSLYLRIPYSIGDWAIPTAFESGLEEKQLEYSSSWTKADLVSDRWTCSQCGASLIQGRWAVAECTVCCHYNGFVDFQTTSSC